MRTCKFILAFVLCLSLFSAGVAQASMLCCVNGGKTQASEASAESDMPCHETNAKKPNVKQDSSSNICNNCKDCVGNAAIILQNPEYSTSFKPITHVRENIVFSSFKILSIHLPPKFIS